MSSKRMMWATPWLFAGTFGLFAACGDAGDSDDDDSPVTNNTVGAATGQTGGSTTATTVSNNAVTTTTGFGNANATITTGVSTATTGDTLIQMNDNCDNIVAEDGATCTVSGLVCSDAFERNCVCGGSDRFPEGIWTCRGTIQAAGGAGGETGAGGGAGAGQDAGGAGN